MLDDDDEVRDRATFYHFILSSGDRELMKQYVLNDEVRVNMQALERALLNYTQASEEEQVQPFDFTSIPLEEPGPEGVSDITAMADSCTAGFFEPAGGVIGLGSTITAVGATTGKGAFAEIQFV